MSSSENPATFIATLASRVDSLAEKVSESYKLTRQVILEYQAQIGLMRNCANCAWSVEEPLLGADDFCQLPLTCISPRPCKDKDEWRERISSFDN